MLGFSVTDAWQVGLGIGLTGDFQNPPSTALQGQALYHLAPTATIIPYVGAHAGGQADVFSANPRIQDVLGPQMGAKLRCGEKVLLIVDLRYSMQAAQPNVGALFLSVGFGLIERPGVQHAETPRAQGGPALQFQLPAQQNEGRHGAAHCSPRGDAAAFLMGTGKLPDRVQGVPPME
jgi:hypothetical protein